MVVIPNVASVVGQVTDNRWGQVLQTPHAYGVVEIYSSDGTARQQGIEILTRLTKIFETPQISLSALKKVTDEMQQGGIISLILLVPVGMTLYMILRGSGRVYLKRGARLAILLEAPQELSGVIQPGDVIIAATQSFVDTLSSQDITGVFDHLSPVDVAEKLTMKLHEKEGGDGGAAFIFRIGEEEEATGSEKEEVAEILKKPAPVVTPIFYHRAKSLGRRITTARQRKLARQIMTRMRETQLFSSKRFITIVVLTLFLISVVLGIFHQQQTKTNTALMETLTQAQHSFDEGMALLDLNPVKGRERLTEARDLLAPVVARKLRSDEGKQAMHLYTEVTDNLKRSMRISHVTPELFFDVSLLKKGAQASQLSLFEDTIGVLDIPGKTIFTVSASARSGSIIAGGDAYKGASNIASYGDKVYVLTPTGIHMVRLTDEKTVPNTIPASPSWGAISDMVAFGGNIYLLDTQKSRIWKYVATDKGFSDLFEYLNPDTIPDLSKTTNMTIDGSVWVGTTTGVIMRFSSGKDNTYAPQGSDTPLGSNLEVFTSDGDKMVYILDVNHHRVVVFDKDGLYMSQYVWDNGLRVTEIVASESLKKLILLADGKLYSINLQ